MVKVHTEKEIYLHFCRLVFERSWPFTLGLWITDIKKDGAILTLPPYVFMTWDVVLI
jgi:hypothetical protein